MITEIEDHDVINNYWNKGIGMRSIISFIVMLATGCLALYGLHRFNRSKFEPDSARALLDA